MNNDYQNMQLGLDYLKTQGVDTKQLEEVVRQSKVQALGNSMSLSDGVYIQKSEADAPGVYISQDQLMQDAYSQHLAMQDQRNESPTARQQFIPEIADLTMGNPNYQVVESPQRVRVGPRGEIIYI